MDKKIAKALADANVVKFGEFTLVSGMKTPVYFDLRILPSYPNSMKIVAEELSKLVKKLKADIVAGAEKAGMPLSTAVSLKTKIPMIYARKMPKSYGTGEMIEGVLQKDAKVVLIDDMTTNGFSKIKFIDGIKHAGGIVKDVFVVLDRQQGGAETLAKAGVKLHSLITSRELLAYMKEHGMIGESKYDEILDYLGGNKG